MSNIGEMRSILEIQRPAEVQDTYGAVVLVYNKIATCRARVRPVSGRELRESAAVAAEISHRITTYRYFDLKPKDRLKDTTTGTIYEVTFIRDNKQAGSLVELDVIERIEL